MKLRNDESYLRDFFEHAPIGFHAFGPDQTIIDINETELKLLGYARQEVVGKKTWSDLIAPEDRIKFKQHWKDILKHRQVRNLEYTMICKDGSTIQVLLNASARVDRFGRLVNTRGSIIDITERKVMEKKLQDDRKTMSNNIRSLQKMIKGLTREKAEWQEHLQVIIRKRIFPLIDKIKRRDAARRNDVIKTLESNLSEVIRGIGHNAYHERWNLSAREIEVCFLVQSGLTTKEISELLCSSVRTIDNHRNHIRKKLGVSGKDVNLGAFLKSI